MAKTKKTDAKDSIITIDFNVWTTIAKKAKAEGVKLGTMSARVKQSKNGLTPNPVEYWEIPQLGITLVKIED